MKLNTRKVGVGKQALTTCLGVSSLAILKLSVLKLAVMPIFFSMLYSSHGVATEAEIQNGLIENEALKQHFKNDFKIGVAVNDEIVSGQDPLSAGIISKQFNTITIENAMKAEIVNPLPDQFNFTAADQFIDFGKNNNMFVVGHTLVWHNQTPDWFFKQKNGEANSPEQQIDRMEQHIKLVAGRYLGKVDAWDVLNEVIGDDGNYRQTVWTNVIGSGDEMAKAAFTFAAKYAPNTELYYNDFNAWKPAKRDGIVRMIKMLQSEGIKIDGVGIQAHWGLNFPKGHLIEEAIDVYAALGLKVMITELDIDVLPFTKEGQVIGQGFMHPQFQEQEFKTYLDPYSDHLPADIEAKLAARYTELFDIFKAKREKIDRVTFWGLHDGMSWKNDYPIPNRTNYPLLWDRKHQPKPAFKALFN
ncbi:endo-1,4-beta-xylanase [Shewanella sp. 10N.286.51.B2]|uniref:endo-1,4-beta-xylanase n=1 Tax=Shewanella sp. 10N.286.51.B2 TaxID=3229707 RepID=UPI00355304CD